tara:strand:- start:290 stop:502 length:213 start_codon:yes stop_codon:yes gene_type:complete
MVSNLPVSSHAQLMAVLKTIEKQIKETEEYQGKPCLFGVGLPSAIASVRNQMTNEIMEAIDSAKDEEQKQ